MPKIIENLREQLLSEAKKQVKERGYAATTVRSVAGACGVGVGTVYNYFKSKEMLVATFVYDDWRVHLAEMERLPDEPHARLAGIYGSLRRFSEENAELFSDADAAKSVSVGGEERHKLLRRQIASFVRPLCAEDFTAEFLAEALIRWSVEQTEFAAVYPILEKIIKK